uniref:Odorant receptor n=1 Tax=Campoletis chlorideae TaxID=219166 RepID=A0A346D3X8_9HYME|nr:odorant receptor [Campoletis chlorideae]
MNSNNSEDLEVEPRVSEKLASRGTMEYSVRYLRCLLRMLGVWPLVAGGNPSQLDKLIGTIMRPVALFYSTLVLLPMFAEVAAQRAPREELISLVAPLAYQAFNVMKHFFLLLRIDIIKTSLKHMEIDWENIDNDKDRGIMVKSIQEANKLAIIITISMYVGGTLHNFILPALADSYVNEFNETIRVLCFPGGDFFLDVQANVVFEIVFVTYWMSDMFVVTVSMALFTLALILLRHSCGQIQILISNLGNLVDPDQDIIVIMENSIGPIVRHHARLLTFSMHIEKILKEVCAMEVICDTLILCFLGYVCIMDISNYDLTTIFTYVMLLVTIAFNLYLYCQIGEVLKEEYQNVGAAAYMIDWYKLPTKASLDLIMIMNMSAQPRQLTAGGMMELSRTSYVSIMKTSFAYLNMLRTMA